MKFFDKESIFVLFNLFMYFFSRGGGYFSIN